MKLTPAQLLKKYLLTLGLVDEVGAPNAKWPCFISSMPDAPDACVCIYDTPGTQEERLHKTGETPRHPGIQVKVRAQAYPDAFAKIDELNKACDGIYKLVIGTDDYDYTVQAMHAQPVIAMGVGDDAKRRNYFSFNCLATLTAVHKP